MYCSVNDSRIGNSALSCQPGDQRATDNFFIDRRVFFFLARISCCCYASLRKDTIRVLPKEQKPTDSRNWTVPGLALIYPCSAVAVPKLRPRREEGNLVGGTVQK